MLFVQASLCHIFQKQTPVPQCVSLFSKMSTLPQTCVGDRKFNHNTNETTGLLQDWQKEDESTKLISLLLLFIGEGERERSILYTSPPPTQMPATAPSAKASSQKHYAGPPRGWQEPHRLVITAPFQGLH